MYVKNGMTADPFTISPEASITDALELMQEKHVRRLPVMKGDLLVGLVTERDVSDGSPSRATSLSVHEMRYLLDKTKISSVMTKDPITISADAFLEEAAVIMRDNKISTLPVMEDGKLVGIITETNIFSAFIDLLGFRDVGSRITVSAGNQPGSLAKIAKIIGDEGVNIAHVAVYEGGEGKKDVVFTVNTPDAEPLAAALNAAGQEVISAVSKKG